MFISRFSQNFAICKPIVLNLILTVRIFTLRYYLKQTKMYIKYLLEYFIFKPGTPLDRTIITVGGIQPHLKTLIVEKLTGN